MDTCWNRNDNFKFTAPCVVSKEMVLGYFYRHYRRDYYLNCNFIVILPDSDIQILFLNYFFIDLGIAGLHFCRQCFQIKYYTLGDISINNRNITGLA